MSHPSLQAILFVIVEDWAAPVGLHPRIPSLPERSRGVYGDYRGPILSTLRQLLAAYFGRSSYWSNLELGDLRHIVFVVNTITKQISKVA